MLCFPVGKNMVECPVSELSILLSSLAYMMVLMKVRVILTSIFSFMCDNIAS